MTDRNGSVEYAALSNAMYMMKLNKLKYSTDATDQKFASYLDTLTSLRNQESHSGQVLQEKGINAGVHIVATMYLYVTLKNITELEMVEEML